MCRDINEMRLTKMIYIVEVILVSIIVFNFSHEWMSPEEPKQFVGSKMPKRTIIHGINRMYKRYISEDIISYITKYKSRMLTDLRKCFSYWIRKKEWLVSMEPLRK